MEVIFVTRGQGEIFLLYFALGLLIGGLFSLSRASAFVLGGGKIADAATLIAAGAFGGAAILGAGAVINNGAWHVYTVLALILGAAGWICFAHKPLAKFAAVLYTKIKPKVDRVAKAHREKRARAYKRRSQKKAERKRRCVQRKTAKKPPKSTPAP